MIFKCLIFVVNSSDNVPLNTDSAPIISPFQAIPYVLIWVEIMNRVGHGVNKQPKLLMIMSDPNDTIWYPFRVEIFDYKP